VAHLDRHLARLAASAAELGFVFEESALREQIAERCAHLSAGGEHRFRLALSKEGRVVIVTAPLVPVVTLGGPAQGDEAEGAFVGVLLAPEHGFAPMRSNDWLLRHKTTRRAEYDRGWREAEANGAFDTLFFNERGELTEGGRSNVFVKLEGRWWTPPLSAGVLPGVMRAVLLDDRAFGAAERELTLRELHAAEALLICNALRGALPARIVPVQQDEAGPQ
jgi:para-aminobenzoate synthetase/4-amino-4-deoxychorismate lyase